MPILSPLFALLLAAPGLTSPAAPPAPVIGGSVADTCQYPATVLMSGCSATLVHPEIVLYAAHCPSPGSVRFGVTGGDRTVSVDYCAAAPEYPAEGFDYKYCKLDNPVTDVPIVPVLMGCDIDQLQIDTPVKLVGFGNTSNGGGGFGTKRWIDGTIAGFPGGGKKIGIWYAENDIGICNGDSGGSAYVQLADGSWRMFGITSTVAGSCGGSSQHIPSWAAVPWVEDHSGIDITPCHDADGAWNPGPGCTDFPMAPDDGAGLSWNQGCGPGPVSPASQTCGPAVGEPQDTNAPTIEIIAPAPGAHPGPSYGTPIEVTASDDYGMLDVSISFDGMEQAFFTEEPYKLAMVNFPEGTWEITARGRDWSGNEGAATPVVIEVGNVGGSTGGAATDSGGSTSGAGTTDGGTTGSGTAETTGGPGTTTGAPGATTTGQPPDTDTDGAGAASDDGGCSCGAGEPAGLAFAPLVLLLGARRRRQ